MLTPAYQNQAHQFTAELYFYYGTAYFKILDYRQAIKHLTKTIELDPAHVLANYNLAAAYYKTNQYTNAIQLFTKSCELDTTLCSRAYYFIGLSYHKIDEKKSAIVWLKKIVQDYPYSYYTSSAEKILTTLGVKSEPVVVLKVTKQKPWFARVDLTGGYDRNIEYQNVDKEGITGIDDVQYTINAMSRYYLKNILSFGYNYYQIVYSTYHFYDYTQHTGSIVWYPIRNSGLTLSITHNYNYSVLATKPYTNTNITVISLGLQETDTLTGTFSYTYIQNDYFDSGYNYLNGKTQSVYLSQYLKILERGYIGIAYSGRNVDANDLSSKEYSYYYWTSTYTWQWVMTDYYRSYSYKSNSIYFNLGIPITNKLNLSISANRETRIYDQPDRWYIKPVKTEWFKINNVWYEYVGGFLEERGTTGPPTPQLVRKTRNDIRDAYSINLSYELSKKFSIFLYYTTSQNVSNITTKDYEDKNYQKSLVYTGVSFKL